MLIFGGFSVVVAASGGLGILLLFVMISIKIQRLEYGRYNRSPVI
ncbi:putative membrane protein [Pseudomonas aeruginosa]|nr:putative membrane protein [Pseudomonas aeruginosa]